MTTRAHTIVIREEKSIGVAYALLIFLGALGLHRFYLDRPRSGTAMLLLSLAGFSMTWPVIGFALLVPVGIWLIADLFLVPGMIQKANAPSSRTS